MPEPNRFQDGNHVGDAAVVVTQEDDSFDGEENLPPLVLQVDEGTEENEEYVEFDPNRPLEGQMIPGPYLFIMNKRAKEMMHNPSTLFLSSHAYACPAPWDSCRGPPRLDGETSIEPGCMFCWMCNHQIQSRIREAGYVQPDHNLFHWGEKTEGGAFSCHAYAIGPIFDPVHLMAIHRLIRDFEFEGPFDYPSLHPYIHYHVQFG